MVLSPCSAHEDKVSRCTGTTLNRFSLFVSLHHQSPQAQRVWMEKLMPETIGFLCIKNYRVGSSSSFGEICSSFIQTPIEPNTIWLRIESGMDASPLEGSFPLGHNVSLYEGPQLMPFLYCNRIAQHKTEQNNERKLEQPPVEMMKESKTRGQNPFISVPSQDHFYSWLLRNRFIPEGVGCSCHQRFNMIQSTLETLLCTHCSMERTQFLSRGSTTPASQCFPPLPSLPLHSRLSGVWEHFQSRASADELEVTRVWNCPALTLEACTHRDKCGAQPLRLATRQP